MHGFFKGLTTVGSWSGLISGVVLLREWMFRHRPRVAFAVAPQGTKSVAALSIWNPSDSQILITRITSWPHQIKITADLEIASIVRAQYGEFGRQIVEPNSGRGWPIVTQESDRGKFIVVVRWRLLKSPSRWRMPMLRWGSTDILQQLRDVSQPRARPQK
jgi:hypothetical protein